MIVIKFLNKHGKEDLFCKILANVGNSILQNETNKIHVGNHYSEIQEQIYAQQIGWAS